MKHLNNKKIIKKIAVLHPTFGYNGGAENVILATAQSLYNLNIETDIYTYKLRENAPDYIKQFKTDIKLNPLVFNKTAKYLANNLTNYDLILIHNFPASIFYGLSYNYAQKNNIKLPKSFWYCHEPSVRLYGNDEKSYKKLQKTLDIIARYTMRLDRFGVEKIDYIIANSVRTKESVKRVYNREAKVIYPCVKQNEKNEKIDIMPISEAEHFIYVGRLEKPKNLDNAILSFKKLLENIENKNLKFIIAGEGRYKNNLKKLAKNIKIDKNIILKGYISEEEKKDLLNKSYALIMPAINEPFGLTVIEALYSSCISIISNLSGVYEVAKDYSISCDMKDIDAIAKAMLEVYENKNIKKKLVESSKEILDNFTVSNYISNMLDYIKNKL